MHVGVAFVRGADRQEWRTLRPCTEATRRESGEVEASIDLTSTRLLYLWSAQARLRFAEARHVAPS